MKEEININDKVEFTARGRTIRGTVTNVKYSRPGSRNAFARFHDLPTPVYRKLVVLPEGQTTGYWTVTDTQCKKIGTGDPEARRRVAEIESDRHRQTQEYNYQRQKVAQAAGLYDLKKGATIEIKFREGWRTKKFSHMSGSGQVGFYTEGDTVDPTGLGICERDRVRFTHAQFVRIPATTNT